MDTPENERIDMALRKYVTSLCAPIWWESARQVIVNSGTMCVVKTPEALIGITNNHVLKTYEKHKAEKHDIFCQLGSAPFDLTEHLIARSQRWDLATFRIPRQKVEQFGHKAFVPHQWPPERIKMTDHVVFGGYPEIRRLVGPGRYPTTVSNEFVSFRRQPHSCTDEQITFHFDPREVTFLPNVAEPLQPGTSLSGISGGPCFKLVAAENRIELGGFIYEGDYSVDACIIFAVQAALVSATGQIAPAPF
jgi:hypothetical protein